jgi:hypothetical protein
MCVMSSSALTRMGGRADAPHERSPLAAEATPSVGGTQQVEAVQMIDRSDAATQSCGAATSTYLTDVGHSLWMLWPLLLGNMLDWYEFGTYAFVEDELTANFFSSPTQVRTPRTDAIIRRTWTVESLLMCGGECGDGRDPDLDTVQSLFHFAPGTHPRRRHLHPSPQQNCRAKPPTPTNHTDASTWAENTTSAEGHAAGQNLLNLPTLTQQES